MKAEDKIAGQPAHERLMESVSRQAKFYLNQPMHKGETPPSAIQVAIVLHALADHTAIMQMLAYRPDSTSPWPQATSAGRWLHDVGNDLESL